jgi:hypothetical protein
MARPQFIGRQLQLPGPIGPNWAVLSSASHWPPSTLPMSEQKALKALQRHDSRGAHWIDGQDDAGNQRITDALGTAEPEPSVGDEGDADSDPAA